MRGYIGPVDCFWDLDPLPVPGTAAKYTAQWWRDKSAKTLARRRR